MKKIKSYILVALMGLTVTSCKDFLTLMPLNEVVLENFWTDEKDVESVLMGAYSALESSDCIVRMAAWGEFRSDNILSGSDNTSSSDDLNKFINENINETNELTTYLCFYKAINYANTVLHFAPEVHKKDPNYRGSQEKAHEAEAIAIRSLAYWYLVRAFKDVPYVTIPSIDDTHDFFIGQTPFNQVLDSLIYDLEKIKDYAPIHYSPKLENASNTSRFTRQAIYAMLADMYLWKQDWDKCIECCEFVNGQKKKEYDELYAEKGLSSNLTLMADKYPLINASDADGKRGRAYNLIFGEGHSFESLFELHFGDDSNNSFVSSYYNGSNPTVGRVKAYTPLGSYGKATSVFNTIFDTRFHEDMKSSNSSYGILKYVFQKVDYTFNGEMVMGASGNRDGIGSARQDNSADPNWIVYRYSEVLLMEAEAKVMKAKSLGTTDLTDSLTNVKNTLLSDAFELVSAVYDRAICKEIIKDDSYSLSPESYKNVDDIEKLVFEERRREFLFEGKRWFDLVRKAMRDGTPQEVYTTVQGKYEGNTKSIELKFANPNALFLPINRDEIKINDNLIQNPAYQRTDEVIKKSK